MAVRTSAPVRGALPQGQGMLLLFGVYLSFGLTPLYWNLLQGVSAMEMVCHRSLWGSLIVAACMLRNREFPEFFRALRCRREVFLIALCSLSHLWNWWIYIWATTNGKVLECSMGHYIVPMISTMLGFFFFRERPGRLQWLGMLSAACGAGILLYEYGSIPWVSLQVALSAALFAFFRKRATVGVGPGMLMELLFTAPFLWGWLVWIGVCGEGHFLAGSLRLDLLLMGCGIVSAIPQLGLSLGIRSVPMVCLGIMQYILPTTVFLLGVFVMREPVDPTRLTVFAFIWAGVALFLAGAVRKRRQQA
ncbi:MAG: EamA family transporter RarD [Desulfovibrionaceae bacterium]|nr:EamA family transporter RarD [Desulfovibrionaceae bacterium]